jgi:hypothetical protein
MWLPPGLKVISCPVSILNFTNSLIIGIHALLKSHLKKSTLDLFEAWRAMKHALLNQLAELRSNRAQQQIRTPIELSGSLYSAVRGWVSHEALRKVEEQRKKKDPPACTGSFTRSQGLPCFHMLKTLQEQNQVLLLEHFHLHWHLKREGAPQLLLEPRQCFEEISRNSRIPKQSTRREPSGFEAVERAAAPRAAFRCSKCGAIGHTRASKACPQRYSELLQPATGPATGATPGPATGPATEPAIEPATGPATGPATEPATGPATGPSTVLAARPSTGPSTGPATGPATEPATELATGPPTELATGPATEPATGLPTELATGPATGPATGLATEPAAELATEPATGPATGLRYDSPEAIYQRYIAARSAWYKSQPRGSIKTNQEYRKAIGLPLRYGKKSYEWCLDYKEMTKYYRTSTGVREWTKEEMMA